jgi:hypothetical protein
MVTMRFLSVHIKDTRELALPALPCKDASRRQPFEPEGALTRNRYAGALIFNFHLPELQEVNSCCFQYKPPSLGHCVIAAPKELRQSPRME